MIPVLEEGGSCGSLFRQFLMQEHDVHRRFAARHSHLFRVADDVRVEQVEWREQLQHLDAAIRLLWEGGLASSSSVTLRPLPEGA